MKQIVRTGGAGAVYIGRRGISRAWLAEATRLQAWTVGFPGPDLLLPPAKCQTYILHICRHPFLLALLLLVHVDEDDTC